eukprot:9123990-Ditylum_brightwellii.AAC.1
MSMKMRTSRKKSMKTHHLIVITLVMMTICRRCIWKGCSKSKMTKKKKKPDEEDNDETNEEEGDVKNISSTKV